MRGKEHSCGGGTVGEAPTMHEEAPEAPAQIIRFVMLLPQ